MKIVYDGSMDPRLCKSVLGETIPALAAEDPDFVYLDADLMNCIGTAKWAAANPDRAINCGIAEANMIGVACGLAAAGFKPMVHTFGPFASRRCYDQLFLSAGYAKNDITIIGTDPGVTAAMNGGTHMPFEDMALYRAIPGATVIDVTDPTMLISVLRQSKDLPGVKYIRVGRKSYAREAMQAAKTLEEEGISAAVVDCFTVKPLDEEAVLAWAGKTGAVVTAENHNRIGGLTSAVSELLARRCPTPLEAVAVEDCFGEVGPQGYLQQRFGLTAEHVTRAAREAVKRKQTK